MQDAESIRSQVDQRVAQENAEREQAKKEEPEDGITSEFVMGCLQSEQLGDGILYAALHKGQIVYAKNSAQWFVWDKHTWRRDDLDRAVSAVETVAQRYAAEIPILQEQITKAMKTGDNEHVKQVTGMVNNQIDKIASRIRNLRKDTGRSNCLKFAHTNPSNQLAIAGTEFDLNPWLLGCQNGVINLITGELEEGRPEDYVLKRCGVEYLGLDVDQSLWEDTIRQIYNDDQEIIEFVQRMFGYGITGVVYEHVFPVLIGRGRNGKSIMVEAITHVMGDYASVVPPELLLDSNRPGNANQSNPELMALKGLRIAIASETDEGRKFSGSTVKKLTGGDTITARGLYDKHPTKFKPTHLLLLLTNHEPGAPVGDMAFWERCFLIRHQLSFVNRNPVTENERRADIELPEKLLKIGPAILAWLVKGCLKWQEGGKLLHPPKSVINSTEEYRKEADYIGQFLETACLRQNGAKVNATDLYIAFTLWFKQTINKSDRFTPSQKMFGTKLKAREEFGVTSSNGRTFYHGLDLSAEYHAKILAAAGLPEDRGDTCAQGQRG